MVHCIRGIIEDVLAQARTAALLAAWRWVVQAPRPSSEQCTHLSSSSDQGTNRQGTCSCVSRVLQDAEPPEPPERSQEDC